MTLLEEVQLLRNEMRLLRKQAARESRSNQQLRARVQLLESENITLRTEALRLTKENEALTQKLDDTTNHKNTLAGMIFKPNVKEKPATGKKIGGQQGHAAHHRAEKEIDEYAHVFLSHCPKCEKSLARSKRTYTRIVEDIASVSPVTTTQYTIEKQRCTSCGDVSATPKGTLPHSRFGTNLLIHILLLRYESRLPLNRIARLLKREHGLTLSEGTIQNTLYRTEVFFRERYQMTLAEVCQAARKHADETGWRIKGVNCWAWLFATDCAVVYTIEETRGKGVPERILKDSPPTSLLTCDDYAGYKNTHLRRQSCWAHLLRVARDGDSDEAKVLYKRLCILFQELVTIVKKPFVLKERLAEHTRVFRTITTIIAEHFSERDTKKVQTRMKNQGAHLIEALLHEGAHLTNNHAERQIRPLAVFRKITGGSRSRRGAETTARNMTIIQTLLLQGADVFDGVGALLSVPSQRFVGEG